MIPQVFTKHTNIRTLVFLAFFCSPLIAKADGMEGLGRVILIGSLIFLAVIALFPLLFVLANHLFKLVQTRDLVLKTYGYSYFALGDFFVTLDPYTTGSSFTFIELGHGLFFLGLLLLGIAYYRERKHKAQPTSEEVLMPNWRAIMGSSQRSMVLSMIALLYVNDFIQMLFGFPFYTYKVLAFVLILLVVVIFIGIWKMLKWVFVPLLLFEIYVIIYPMVHAYYDLRQISISCLTIGVAIYYLQKQYQQKKRT